MNISSHQWELFKRNVRNMPQEEIARIKRKNVDEAERLYRRFTESFKKGLCDSCRNPINSFSSDSICFHWLLRPNGSKKVNIKEVLEAKGYFRSASYIRWVCNQDVHLARINDLSEEGDTQAIFHWSGQYLDTKWTFVCTSNDYHGHQGHESRFPHYHIEMRLHDRIFIRFNEFHLKFTDEDLFNLRCDLDVSCPVKHTFGPHGSGMEDALSIPSDKIMEGVQITDNPDEAVYHIHTILTDKKGIPGEIIQEALQRSKDSGKPVATFLRELGYSPQVCIEPIDNIPDKQDRNHPRRDKKH